MAEKLFENADQLFKSVSELCTSLPHKASGKERSFVLTHFTSVLPVTSGCLKCFPPWGSETATSLLWVSLS